jgi:hypothetical protein
MRFVFLAAAMSAALLVFRPTAHSALSAQQIIDQMLESDPWGMSGAEVVGAATVKDQGGSTKVVRFTSRSRRIGKNLSKSLTRITAPADLKGVGLLQIQNEKSDDERHLFLPDLKRARRIVGSSRSGSFVGTDFSYGDMDRKDFRESTSTLKGNEKLGKHECYRLEIVPSGKEALYAKIEAWVRTDNFVPLKILMYSKSGGLLKTQTVQEIQKISGRWFIMKSTMVSENERRSTELVLEKVTVDDKIDDGEFTVQNLERL